MAEDRPDIPEGNGDAGDGGRGPSPGDGRKSPRQPAPDGDSVGQDGEVGPSADLGPILAGWPAGGNRATVRLVRTVSGARAIQVRLELTGTIFVFEDGYELQRMSPR